MNAPDNVVGPINLGNPHEFTIAALAEAVIEITNSPSKIIYMPLPQDDPKQRKPIITLAQTMLDWQPKIQLKAGLEKTVAYFDVLLSKGNLRELAMQPRTK
jgi:UDP-glucuronate decarboxylase